MEEINLKELFLYIKDRILIMIAIVLGVLVLGCAYSVFLKTPLYKSTSTVLLVSDEGLASGGTSNITYTDLQVNQKLVGTYSELVKSRAVLSSVINNLALDYSVEQLSSKITVSTVKDTEIIKIEVNDPDASIAAVTANEIVKVFGEEIKRHYKLQNVSVVDVAEEPDSAYNINIIKDLVMYVLVGIVLSLGVVFVIYYFDTTIKSADDVEKKLGLPVLGIVPKVKVKEA